MDTRMIPAGRAPDIMGAYSNGLATAAQQQEIGRVNALNRLYQEAGPQIMAGQPQALNRLAQFDPGVALGVQQTREDMAYNAEDLALRKAQAKAEAEKLLAENAAALDAQTAQQHRQEMMGTLAGGAMAYDQGPQAFEAWAKQIGLPLTYDGFRSWAAQTAGELEAVDELLKLMPKQEPGWRPATAEEAARYGATAGQIDGKTGKFDAINPPNGTVIETLPGGGTRIVQGAGAAAMAKDQRRADMAATSGDVITTAADRAVEAFKGLSPLGPSAVNLFAWNPMTDSAELVRQVGVLKSNATISALQAMREASPTGGALGSVTERENAMLADKAGALDPTSPNFLRDLADYTQTLLRTVHGQAAGDALFAEWAAKNGLTVPQQASPPPLATNAAPLQPGAVLRFDEQGNMMP